MNAFDCRHNTVIIPSYIDSSYNAFIVPTCSAIVITRVFLSGTEKYLTNTAASTLTDDANKVTRTGEFSTTSTNNTIIRTVQPGIFIETVLILNREQIFRMQSVTSGFYEDNTHRIWFIIVVVVVVAIFLIYKTSVNVI